MFGQGEYERLASISVGHLHNLRRTPTYTSVRRRFKKTHPRPNSISERRKGRPGYLPVDAVHQGDLDRLKGIYHINAVDEVAQLEMVCAVEKINKRYLIPVLEALLAQFPFIITVFHADNGA